MPTFASDPFHELFPPTGGAPVPWPHFSTAGGLAVWNLRVYYTRHRDQVTIHTRVRVPDRDNANHISEIGASQTLRFDTLLFGYDYDTRHLLLHAKRQAMNIVRNFVLHECLEGLLLNGARFYEEEVERDHSC